MSTSALSLTSAQLLTKAESIFWVANGRIPGAPASTKGAAVMGAVYLRKFLLFIIYLFGIFTLLDYMT